MHLYLADWAYDPGEDSFVSPYKGTIACLDVSFGTQQLGIFATHDLQPTGQYLGDNAGALVNRRDFERAFQLGERLVAGTAADAIWEILTKQSDPNRAERPRPLMPNWSGQMNLYIGGRLWKAKKVGVEDWAPTKANLHRDYRIIRAAALSGKYPSGHHRKVLAVWQRKYGVEDYAELIPVGLPDEKPLKPATTVSDDFSRSDEALETSDDWNLTGGSGGGTVSLVIVSNHVEDDGGRSSSAGQHQTALSTDDHFAEITIEALTAPTSTRSYGGCMARHSLNTLTNGYAYQATIDSSSTKRGRLLKWTTSSGTSTTLVDEVESINLSDVIRIEANGSDIAGKINGSTTAGPTTDTSITGDLNVGFVLRALNAVSQSDVQVGDFSGGDLGNGPTFPIQLFSRKQNTLLRM